MDASAAVAHGQDKSEALAEGLARANLVNRDQTQLAWQVKFQVEVVPDQVRNYARLRTVAYFGKDGLARVPTPFARDIVTEKIHWLRRELIAQVHEAVKAAGCYPEMPAIVYRFRKPSEGLRARTAEEQQRAAAERAELEAKLALGREMQEFFDDWATWVDEGMRAAIEKMKTDEEGALVNERESHHAIAALERLPTGSDTGADLLDGETPPIDWLIENFLPASGLTLVAGRPKGGKSSLVYQMAFAAATGLDFLGQPVARTARIALITPDDPSASRVRRRFQVIRDKMPGANDPAVVQRFKDNLVATYYEWPGSGERFLPSLELLLNKHPDLKVVVVDSFANIQKQKRKSDSLFESDYGELAEMRRFALEKEILLLLVIHTRKAQSFAADPIDEIQGTSGRSAGVDDFWGLRFDPKLERSVLSMKGRNVDFRELYLAFCPGLEATGGGGHFIVQPPTTRPLTGRERRLVGAVRKLMPTASLSGIAAEIDEQAGAIQGAVKSLVARGVLNRRPKESGSGFWIEVVPGAADDVPSAGAGDDIPF